MCAGQPRDDDWDTVQLDSVDAIEKAASQCRFSAKQSNHRRGEFPALATGVSFGGGQKVCPITIILYTVPADTIVGPR
jgi:hypothetical protein